MSSILFPTFSQIQAADDRLSDQVIRTPVLESYQLNKQLGCRLLLKAEALQRTGSFKFRGAYNKISQIPSYQRDKGVVAYSSGNHAQGVAAAALLRAGGRARRRGHRARGRLHARARHAAAGPVPAPGHQTAAARRAHAGSGRPPARVRVPGGRSVAGHRQRVVRGARGAGQRAGRAAAVVVAGFGGIDPGVDGGDRTPVDIGSPCHAVSVTDSRARERASPTRHRTRTLPRAPPRTRARSTRRSSRPSSTSTRPRSATR